MPRRDGTPVGYIDDGTAVLRTADADLNGWRPLYWLDGDSMTPNPARTWATWGAIEAEEARRLLRLAAEAERLDEAPRPWFTGPALLRPAHIFAMQAAASQAKADRLEQLGRIARADESQRLRAAWREEAQAHGASLDGIDRLVDAADRATDAEQEVER
jgi:hypothetical protein